MNTYKIKALIFAVTASTVISQLLLKGAFRAAPRELGIVAVLVYATKSPMVYLSICLQAIAYLGWIVVISKEKLGIAAAISGSMYYILVALSALLIYDEVLTRTQWSGLLFITAGVILVSARI
jgi:drug/metabolite transporter (DMT)-like permease